MRLRLVALSLLSQALAAHVQSRACLDKSNHESSRDIGGPFGLSVWMNPTASNDDSRLTLVFSGYPINQTACDAHRQSNFSSSVQLASLGSSSIYNGVFKTAKCTQSGPQEAFLQVKFSYPVARPHFLDTYWLTAKLASNGSSGCLNAYMTPDVGKTVSQTATWVPVAIFIIGLVSGLWKEARTLSSNNAFDAAGHSSEPRRSHIIRIADCISYLQFIFFSGALSLSFPGFLQPIVSHMNWSTLMLPVGVVVHEPWYSGVNDGIHEINGTFGGTEGLEMMTQVVGGTVTIDTWLNTITLSAFVFVLILGLILQGRRLSRTRPFFGSKTMFGSSEDEDDTFKTAVMSALRLFFSYLLLPLVAWTTYLLNYGYILPVYYTAAASFFVSCLVALIWFGMWRSSPRRMGYLLVDDIRAPKSISEELRWQDAFAAVVFVLLVLRGVAVGGLQAFGFAQVMLLLVIEVINLALFAFAYRQSPLASQTGRMPAIRMVVLLLEIGFVPGTAGRSAQIVLGYAVLLIHTFVLIFLFLVPGIYTLYRLSTRSSAISIPDLDLGDGDADHPPVFTLRQIMRRPTRDATPEPQPWNGNTLYSQAPSPPLAHMSDRTASLHSREVSYFRSPRPNSSIEAFSRASYSSPPESSPTASSSDASDSRLNSDKNSLDNAMGTPSTVPYVDPNVDYSFREADLYYFQPRTKCFGEDKEEQKTRGLPRIKIPFSKN